MYNCNECDRVFDTKQQLGGHKSSHKTGPRYSVSRKKNHQTYFCKNCNVEFSYNKSSSNKFCGLACSGEFQRKQTVIKIENGENVGIGSIKNYLLDKCNNTCTSCGVPAIWNGKPLTLHLDHIDGDSDNNNLINLRILCPNCHSQTETFGARGKGSRYNKIAKRNTYLRKYKGSLV